MRSGLWPFGIKDSDPLDRIPLQDLIGKAEQGRFAAEPVRVFAFDHIAEAHRIMEAGQANGKLVVTLT
jgi:NADPH:quinone reductase-like Zn-dependent oxidoreductase